MIIKDAQFLISNTDYRKGPSDGKPEYAFIGRSNVGKSSLINMLTNHKGLAMTSSKPGKTQLINHFTINKGEWYLVDLPGYGYAQRGKEGRENIRKIIESYILNRSQLTSLFLLLDSRHEPQKIDLEFINWLGENGIPFAIVFTKIDKLGKQKVKGNVDNYLSRLQEDWEEFPPVFMTSSEHKLGKEELLDYIDQINKTL
ncbi:ribosome biogenesis GTP-binding protein YihA/YsxC [Dysgonomonas sp. 25]|uniref:ribosome biogenesis GTP-binding protein YihA/YsxC n=1 Tax=Dysgonomonas sp. 25 TaxID=2302933 RepID=UPI0013D4CE00|nr:ribosome biogenesis GTP-binding protein YihA/YsxC [Dysgonomonas sp. 25]NDV68874.1 YihA family ribosome biogenesis GTP-binding protein [Dysgonomonas sp. 25]